MAKAGTASADNGIYHVLNRATAGWNIFETVGDSQFCIKLLERGSGCI